MTIPPNLVSYIVNVGRGGIYFSDSVIDEYNLEMEKIGNPIIKKNRWNSYDNFIKRDDQIMGGIIRRSGEDGTVIANCNLNVEYYDIKYSNYVKIYSHLDSYGNDSEEYILIKINKYKIDKISEIIKSIDETLNKVEEIEKILNIDLKDYQVYSYEEAISLGC